MAKVRGRDSKPELIVRRLVHAAGYRYRLHDKSLPGTPDLVFRRKKKVIFVHGCFWHRHPDPACKLARMPKTKLAFWQAKLQGNRERDLRFQAELERAGWRFLLVWECEMSDREHLENRLRSFLDGEAEK
jgi:DNA mismatch endonuclease (patch repair protein)